MRSGDFPTVPTSIQQQSSPTAPDQMTRGKLFELYVSGPALNAFAHVCKSWNLDEEDAEQVLGGDFVDLPKNKPNTAALSLDQVERISHVLRIFRLLGILGVDSHSEWLKQSRSEPIFGGRSALDVMSLPDNRGLRQIVRHLEALTGEEPDDTEPGEH